MGCGFQDMISFCYLQNAVLYLQILLRSKNIDIPGLIVFKRCVSLFSWTGSRSRPRSVPCATFCGPTPWRTLEARRTPSTLATTQSEGVLTSIAMQVRTILFLQLKCEMFLCLWVPNLKKKIPTHCPTLTYETLRISF